MKLNLAEIRNKLLLRHMFTKSTNQWNLFIITPMHHSHIPSMFSFPSPLPIPSGDVVNPNLTPAPTTVSSFEKNSNVIIPLKAVGTCIHIQQLHQSMCGQLDGHDDCSRMRNDYMQIQ